MLAKVLNAVFRAPPVRWLLPTPAIEDRSDLEALVERRRPAAVGELSALISSDQLRGRDVADVGCGLGDKTCAAVAAGACNAVGIDLDPEKLARARALARGAGAGEVRFAVGSAARLPLPDDSRDVVLLLETIEHVDDPAEVLAECRRVLRREGRLVVTFPPYRSPWGAHLFQHIAVPWSHLLLAEHEVLELWRGLHRDTVARTGSWVTPSQTDRIDRATTLDELWSLNGMTIRRFLELSRDAGLEIVDLRFKTPGGLGGALFRSARLREYLVTGVTAIMEPSCK